MKLPGLVSNVGTCALSECTQPGEAGATVCMQLPRLKVLSCCI